MVIEEILALESRRRIYDFILKNPGLHFREISRALSMPKTTLEYHLRYLITHELLVMKTHNGYNRYYVVRKIGDRDKPVVSILRQAVPRNIILYLLLYPDSSLTQIQRFAKRWKQHPSKIGLQLNKHPTTIAYHLDKLCKMGLVEQSQVNHVTKYRLKNMESFIDLLIIYEKSILGSAAGRVLKWCDYHAGGKVLDQILDATFDIFPHPYYD